MYIGLCLALLLSPSVLHADDSQPLVIHIQEVYDRVYQVAVKPSTGLNRSNTPSIEFPDTCQVLGAASSEAGPSEKSLYQCPEGLAGRTLDIHYLAGVPAIATLIRFELANGERHTDILASDTRGWLVPEKETLAKVAWDYTYFGIVHIWAGIDHLLFLVCLLWIAGGLRRIVITVTGFTLAHSITLALSVLDMIHLPPKPVEAVIALSIVFLATEIARAQDGPQRNTLTWRYPVAVSSTFGLIHGLGFAAVLREIGLPQVERATGLLFFNVGVELGQLLFVAALLLFVHWVYVPLVRHLPWYALQRSTVYGIGGLASFWMVERIL